MKKEKKEEPVPEYVPPRIVTYTREQILEQIGPAQACSPFESMSPDGIPLDKYGQPIDPSRL